MKYEQWLSAWVYNHTWAFYHCRILLVITLGCMYTCTDDGGCGSGPLLTVLGWFNEKTQDHIRHFEVNFWVH